MTNGTRTVLAAIMIAAASASAVAEPIPAGTGVTKPAAAVGAADTSAAIAAPEETWAVATAAGAATTADAQINSRFIKRFAGEWKGSGKVLTSAEAKPRTVSCKMLGTTAEASIDITGDCRALAIFKREIGATLVSVGDRFTGVYSGSRLGDAKLAGAVRDDTLFLEMEWPEKVNGDTKAEMRIVNSGDGRLSLQVVDQDDADGRKFVATDLTFERSQ